MLKLFSPNFSDLYTPNIEIGKFPDGDSHIHIPDSQQLAGKSVMLFHRLYPNQNDSLMELLLILANLKERGCKVTVAAPYLPYARQDKKTMDGEVQSAHLVCNLLKEAGCEKLVTFDCHFLNVEGETTYGNLPIHNISMNTALHAGAQKFFGTEDFDVIGPDDGAKYLTAPWGGKTMKKQRRSYENGKVGYRQIETLVCEFDVVGKNVFLLDDMISTGSTVVTAIEKLRACGAKKICVGTTHGLFLYNCLDKIRKLCDHVFATDTILSPLSEVSVKAHLEELGAAETRLF